MPLSPVVAVVISTAGTPPAYAPELVTACTQALPQGACALSGALPDEQNAEAVAIVSWKDAGQTDVRIQVGVRRERGGTSWLSRDMHFRDIDAPVERWRAVGLTIATLVGELPPPRAAPPAPASAPRPRFAPVPRRTGKPSPEIAERWWVDAGGLVGPGLDTGSWRGGAYALVARRFDALAIHAFASYAVRATDARGVSASWLTAGLGPGLVVDVSSLALDARAAVALARVQAAATAGDAEDSGSRWVPEIRLGADVAWPRGYLSVVAGGDMWVMQSATAIRIDGESVGTVPKAGGVLRLGLRLALP